MCGRQAGSCYWLGFHVPNRASPVPLAGRIPGTPLYLAWPMEGHELQRWGDHHPADCSVRTARARWRRRSGILVNLGLR